MTPTLAIVLAIVAVVGGGRALYSAMWGPRARARKRSTSRLTQIVDGSVVTLEGEVRAVTTIEAMIEATLSGTTCVAFLALENATYGGQVVASIR